jgi:serpin B
MLGVLAASLLVAGSARGEPGSGRVEALTQAYNESGQELFKGLAAKPGNIVISPYSIGALMAMALSGASGDNAAEMIRVLKHRLPESEIAAANREAHAVLRAYDRNAAAPSCPEGTRFSTGRCEADPWPDGLCPRSTRRDGEQCIADPVHQPSAQFAMANSLMITGFGKRAILENYVERIRSQYDGEVFENATLADVNGWVSRKTKGKIPTILEELDPSTAAVLLNAVHFKGAWASPFNKKLTREAPFHLSSAETVNVPTMINFLKLRYMEGPGYRAIRLPFETEELGLVVVLPDDAAGIGGVSAKLAAGGLSQMLSKLRSGGSTMVDLALPRFQASYKASLIPYFQDAGMRKAFEFGHGFSRMLAAEAMISKIEHRAVIEASEEGCEASAATAAAFLIRSVPSETPVIFHAARPFLFYLEDNATGAILFQGRISDPRAS